MPEQDENLDVLIEKLFRTVLRRRWWVLVPTTIIAVGAALATFLLPKRYESQATILVESQQVPERYVTANTVTDMRQVLLVMTDAILSRTQLLQIISEFGLYPKESKRLAPEQLVELMRSNITIEPTQKGSEEEPKAINAFRISFMGQDARSAQVVTARLTDLFIKENNESREEQSTGTTKFLTDQLQAAEAELKQQDIRVRDFKMHNLGELPEQQTGNLAILGVLHQQLQNDAAALARAREQQVYLQSLLQQYKNLAAAGVTVNGVPTASPTDQIKAELVRLQDQKAELLSRGYTERYPDVVKVEEQIKQTESLLAAALAASASASDEAASKAAKQAKPTERDSAMAQLRSQLESNRVEIENLLADQKQIQSRVEEYQRRIDSTPVREQQLNDLMRGEEEAKKHYDDLMAKKSDSELSTSLIMRQQGERFRIIDQPSWPSKPSSPDRLKISLGGLAAGLAVGLGLALFVESRNHSLREEGELRRMFSFPLVLGVPVLLDMEDVRKRSRIWALEWAGGTLMGLLVCAAEFYVYWRS